MSLLRIIMLVALLAVVGNFGLALAWAIESRQWHGATGWGLATSNYTALMALAWRRT